MSPKVFLFSQRSKSVLDSTSVMNKSKKTKYTKQRNTIVNNYKLLLRLNFLWNLPHPPRFLDAACEESTFWTSLTIIFNACRTILSISIMQYSHVLYINTSLAVTCNIFFLFSTAVSWSLLLKRREVLNAIKKILAVNSQVNHPKFRSKWNIYLIVMLNVAGCFVFWSSMSSSAADTQKLMNATGASFLSYQVTEEYKLVFHISLLFFAVISAVGNTITCSLAVQLISAMYFHLGDIILNFGHKLRNTLEYEEISQESLSKNLTVFQSIKTLNCIVNDAVSVAAMFIYGAMISIFFCGICTVRSYKSEMNLPELILLISSIFLFSLYCFCSLTLTGDRVKRKHDGLKAVIANCSNIVLMSNLNVKGIMWFSLMSTEIRSATLYVSGGNMFHINSGLMLTVAGTLLTYGIILFQMT